MGFEFVEVLFRGIYVGIAASITVGPVAVLCIQRTLSKNRRSGIVSGFGVACADTFLAMFALFFYSLLQASIEQYSTLLRVVAGILVVIFGVYIWSNLRDAKSGMAENREARQKGRTVSRRQMVEKLFLFALGITAIVIGSQLLINYGSELALLMGVPASIIGVTMVAIGTSLPELVTTLTAIAKKEASMSVGNIIGANVIDLTMILPVCSAVSAASGDQLTIGLQTTTLDLPVCWASACWRCCRR